MLIPKKWYPYCSGLNCDFVHALDLAEPRFEAIYSVNPFVQALARMKSKARVVHELPVGSPERCSVVVHKHLIRRVLGLGEKNLSKIDVGYPNVEDQHSSNIVQIVRKKGSRSGPVSVDGEFGRGIA